MSDQVRALAVQQRRRMVATVMGVLEAEVWPSLSVQKQQEVRRKVLASIDVYHDLMLDIIKTGDQDGVVFNEEAIRLLRRIHSVVAAVDDFPVLEPVQGR